MKTSKKLLASFSSLLILLSMVTTAHAQITNPVVGEYGDNPGTAAGGGLFVKYFLTMWNAVLSVGALVVLVYFLWGAIEWVTSAGDSAKLQTARNRMLHSFIGLFLLVTAYTIIGFISGLLFGTNFNILTPEFITPN